MGDELVWIIGGRFAWCARDEAPRAKDGTAYFSTDETLVYEQFFADFGPLNLSKTVRYCRRVEAALAENDVVVHYCAREPQSRCNAICLCVLFSVIVLKKTVAEAYDPFIGFDLPPYRDAGFGVCSFPLLIIDVAKGAFKAIQEKHFNYETFDIESYETMEKLEGGDMNWIVPGKFLAHSGPLAYRRELQDTRSKRKKFTFDADDYAEVFVKKGVTRVVRLNKKLYDRQSFLSRGIEHSDLIYEDGSNPPPHIAKKFLDICESEKGAIAVHCKAGLGRTGTLIALYMMKHYRYTAHEVVGWLRLCRPGSIIGPQQFYVAEAELRMHHEGALFERSFNIKKNPITKKNISPKHTSDKKKLYWGTTMITRLEEPQKTRPTWKKRPSISSYHPRQVPTPTSIAHIKSTTAVVTTRSHKPQFLAK